MTVSKKSLASMLENMRVTITQEQFEDIFAKFSKEPDDCHEWSEQDIYEQIRKLIR